MSGTSRTVMSSVVGKKGKESALTKALDNENEVAKQEDIKGGKKQK